MTQNKNQNIYLVANNLHGYGMSKFLLTSGFKWIDPKDFDRNKYSRISSTGCVLEVDLEYPKELRELHNDYCVAPDKTEIKEIMLSKCQLMLADLNNIHIGTVKKLVLNFIVIKSMCFIMVIYNFIEG